MDLQSKLVSSEEDRHRLQDLVFILQERLHESNKRLDQCMAEASMNAQGLSRCVEEKEMVETEYVNIQRHHEKLEEECAFCEREFQKAVESLDKLAKDNEELRAQEQKQDHDRSRAAALAAEVASLKKDKENMRINLLKAEEEVKIMYEENNLLEKANKQFADQLAMTASRKSSSAKGKRKSSLVDNSPKVRGIEFKDSSSPRQPLSQFHQNSPDSIRKHKKLFAT